MKFVPSLAAGAALSLFSAGLASAGMTYVNATRSVVAVAHGGLVVPEDRDTQTSTDFAAFNGQVNAEFLDELDGDIGRASMSQNSLLGPSSITASGFSDVKGLGEFGLSESTLDVTFDVDTAGSYAFSFTAFDSDVEGPPYGSLQGSAGVTASLVAEGGTVLFSKSLQTEGAVEFLPFTFDEAGLLDVGRYTLSFAFDVESSYVTGPATDYAVSFSVTDGSTPAVPLPAAVWPGVAMLGALVWRRVTRNA